MVDQNACSKALPFPLLHAFPRKEHALSLRTPLAARVCASQLLTPYVSLRAPPGLEQAACAACEPYRFSRSKVPLYSPSPRAHQQTFSRTALHPHARVGLRAHVHPCARLYTLAQACVCVCVWHMWQVGTLGAWPKVYGLQSTVKGQGESYVTCCAVRSPSSKDKSEYKLAAPQRPGAPRSTKAKAPKGATLPNT